MEAQIQKVDQGYFPELKTLVDAIECNDLELAKDSIQTLMDKKAIVQLNYMEKKYICDSHSYFFPNLPSKFSLYCLTNPINCLYDHKFCNECIFEYVKQKFSSCKLEYNYYQCIACESYEIPHTLILDYDTLEQVVLQLFGEQTIYNIRNFNPTPVIFSSTVVACYKCNSSNKTLFAICRSLHSTCSNCAENWAKNSNNVRCLVYNCESDVNCHMIIKALQNSKALSKLKESFKSKGIIYNTCPKCCLLVNLDYKSKITVCKCGQKICNNCERPAHFETCFFFESTKKYEEIVLRPPIEIGKPKNLREQEYLNAKYAFENFFEAKNRPYHFKSAKLIVNKTLEERYAAKKKKMIKECGGFDKIGEVYIWHGSPVVNYPGIMREGLKVGGVDYGVGVAVGTRFGYGIYSSTAPDTPITYAKDSHFLIACLAMKGIPSHSPIFDTTKLDLGKSHSFKPVASETEKNWWVFFTKEQVLPRFLIEYA